MTKSRRNNNEKPNNGMVITNKPSDGSKCNCSCNCPSNNGNLKPRGDARKAGGDKKNPEGDKKNPEGDKKNPGATKDQNGSKDVPNNKFLLSKEQIRYIKNTAYITGLGMVCETVANSDKLYSVLIKDPFGFLKNMSIQFCGNLTQNFLIQWINAVVTNNSNYKIWMKTRSKFTRVCVSSLQFTTISFGISTVRSYICDKRNDRSYYDFCMDIAENIVQNNLTLINSALRSRWLLWKSVTNQITSFSRWLPQFISTNYGKTYLGQIILPIIAPLGVLELGPVLSGIMTILIMRIIRSLAFRVPTFISNVVGGLFTSINNINKSHTQIMIDKYDRFDDNDGSGSGFNSTQKKNRMISKYQQLKNKKNRTFKDEMEMSEMKDKINENLESISISDLTISYDVGDTIIKDKKYLKSPDLSSSREKAYSKIGYKPRKLVTNYKSIKKYNHKIPEDGVKSISKTTKKTMEIDKSPCLINFKKLDYSRLDFEKLVRAEVIHDVVPTSAYVIDNVIRNIPDITFVDKEFENSLMVPVAQAVSVC